MKDDAPYVLHILEAIAKIERYTNGMLYEAFVANELVQDGVVRELQIIGEAAKRLSENFKARHSEIPWKKITGTRDKLIHDYFETNVELIFEVVERDLPELKAALQKNT